MLQSIKYLINNYKYYRRVKNHPHIKLWEDRLPSQVYYKYRPETDFDGKKVLNIGCGLCTFVAPNVVNLDGAVGEGINVVWDLSKTPLPFKENTFDLIIANHVLEHIPNWFNCFKDLARVLKIGGIIEVWIPPVSSNTTFTYRDHINRIGVESFSGCYNSRQAGSNLLSNIEYHEINDHYARLELIWMGYTTIFKWWIMLVPQTLCAWMVRHLRNVVSEEGYKFTKRLSIEGRPK